MEWEDLITYADVLAEMRRESGQPGQPERPAGATDDRAAFIAHAQMLGG